MTSDSNGSSRAAGRLDSWKEIAAYLHRSVPTVQRWEKTEGLPQPRADFARDGFRHTGVYSPLVSLTLRAGQGSRCPRDPANGRTAPFDV